MQKIEEIALNSPPLTFTKFDDARDLALRVVRAVASHYHPHSKLPEFAIPAPHLLLLVEKAAREYRDTMLWIPAANELKMDTIFNWTQTSGKWAPMAKMVYKIADHAWTAVRLYAEPQTGMSRLIKGHFLGQAGGTVLDAAYRSATRWLVASLGREAINLYSGRLSHSDRELVEASQRDAATARQSRMAPPRFLLAGQINAGKSSLINALANEVLSDVRPVPTTSDVAEHVLTIEGEECAILVDMTGLTNDDASRAALFD
jgi:hypothetical protein